MRLLVNVSYAKGLISNCSRFISWWIANSQE